MKVAIREGKTKDVPMTSCHVGAEYKNFVRPVMMAKLRKEEKSIISGMPKIQAKIAKVTVSVSVES